MLYYLIIIGVFNLGLGYVLAVYLGYGPPSLSSALHAMNAFAEPRIGQPVMIDMLESLDPAIAECIVPTPEAPPAAAVVANEIVEPAPAEEPISHVAMLDDRDSDEVFVQPAFEAYDDDAVELLRRDQPDAWETNSKYIETSIQDLNVAMMKSGVRAIELDNRLRACKGCTDAATIQDCLAQLKEDCQTYLNELAEANERFHGRIGDSDELSGLASANEMSNLEQAAQIETTLNNLENMDFRSDLDAANHRLIEELDHLRVARHAWRDAQEAAFLGFARIENSLDKIEKQLHDDATTGLPNRIGLEIALGTWWREGRQQQQPIAAALLDIDGLGKLNRLHGALVGDTVLYQVVRHLRKTAGADDLVGRVAGGSFLVVVPGHGPEAACKMVELLRQSIAQIHFKLGEETLRITISAGVTEVQPDEPSHEPMFARLAESLKKAKQSGRNRSFFHNGGEPRPVDVPPPSVAPIDIAL